MKRCLKLGDRCLVVLRPRLRLLKGITRLASKRQLCTRAVL
jgi:hypothetical protein